MVCLSYNNAVLAVVVVRTFFLFFRHMKRFKVWRKHQCWEPWKIICTNVQASCLRRWLDVWQQYIAGFKVHHLWILRKTDHLYCQGPQLMLYFQDVALMEIITRISLARPMLKFHGYQPIRTNFIVHLMPLVTIGWFINFYAVLYVWSLFLWTYSVISSHSLKLT